MAVLRLISTRNCLPYCSTNLPQRNGSLHLFHKPVLHAMHTCMLFCVLSWYVYLPSLPFSIEKSDKSSGWVVPEDEANTQASALHPVIFHNHDLYHDVTVDRRSSIDYRYERSSLLSTQPGLHLRGGPSGVGNFTFQMTVRVCKSKDVNQ